MEALVELCRALGLSGAAGLNAYIPLLVVGVLQHQGMVHLTAPYDALGTWWCIAILVVLLIIEMVVDKIPGADHVNDIIQTAIRPAAGVILFLSSVGGLTWVHPAVWVVVALLLSGGVHGLKTVSRPMVNVATVGLGAPVVSLVEDLVSIVLTVVAILVPVMAVILLVVFALILWKMFVKFMDKDPIRRRVEARKKVVRVKAVPVGPSGTEEEE